MRWPASCPALTGSFSWSSMDTLSGLSSRSARPSSQASAQHGLASSRNRPPACFFAHTTPGWQWRLTAPLQTDTVFAKDSPHQVIAPNKVIELKENSVMLEKKFEKEYELPFFVSRCTSTRTVHSSEDSLIRSPERQIRATLTRRALFCSAASLPPDQSSTCRCVPMATSSLKITCPRL
jgi:hypothetical protein